MFAVRGGGLALSLCLSLVGGVLFGVNGHSLIWCTDGRRRTAEHHTGTGTGMRIYNSRQQKTAVSRQEKGGDVTWLRLVTLIAPYRSAEPENP